MRQTKRPEVHVGYLALIVLAAAAAFSWLALLIPAEPAYGQHSGAGATIPVESTSKPANFEGTWTDTDAGYIEYEASTSTGKWLGPDDTFHYGKNATGVTGALNMNTNVPCDTTSGGTDGYAMPDSAYITRIRCTNDELIAAACSLEIFAATTRLWAGAWTGNTEYFTPTPIVWPANVRLSVYVKSGATNPNRPLVDVIARRFVSQ